MEKTFLLTEYGKIEGDPAAYTITVEAPLRPFSVDVFSDNKLSLIASRTFSDGWAEAGREEDTLKGILKKSPIRRPIIPQWGLGMVLKALCGAPSQSLQSVHMDILSYKKAFLLSFCSAKHIGDILHICSLFICHLCSLHKTTPKWCCILIWHTSLKYRLCHIKLSRCYTDHTPEIRQMDQLYVCFTNPIRGKVLLKQRFSHWAACQNAQMPRGVCTHSIRGIAVSWAHFKGVLVEDVCLAASWSSLHTFMMFYSLDVTAQDVIQ